MQSTRINKEGKVVPSTLDAYGYSYPAYTGAFEVHQRHQGHSCAYDADNDEIGKDWSRKATTALSLATSLGKPTKGPDLSRMSDAVKVANEIRSQGRSVDQDGLNQFLVQMNRFTAGDYITFTNYPPNGTMVSHTTISYILSVDRKFEECVWSDKESVPKPFLLLDLSPMLPNSQIPMTARFSNCLYCRHITADEALRFTKNNVQLQNYIQQAKDAAKTSSLTIRG